MRLSVEQFQVLVDEALRDVPEPFRKYLDGLAIDIEDQPDAETVRRLGLRDRRSLLGLYHGVPITKRSVMHLTRPPERIVLYQANIERICASRDELIRQIRKTVLHEIGHHFGLGEDELAALGY